MNRKLLRGLVLGARGRGDRIPQRLRYLVEPIALAGNICHVPRLLFVDHSVPLIGVSPACIHYELLTVIGADNLCALPGGTGHELLNKPLAPLPYRRGRVSDRLVVAHILRTPSNIGRILGLLIGAAHPTEDWAEKFAYYSQTPLIDFAARPGWLGRQHNLDLSG
jgi:hypothetical protein